MEIRAYCKDDKHSTPNDFGVCMKCGIVLAQKITDKPERPKPFPDESSISRY